MLRPFPHVHPLRTMPRIVERLVRTTPDRVMPDVKFRDDNLLLSGGGTKVDISALTWIRDLIFNGLRAWAVEHGFLHKHRPVIPNVRCRQDFMLCSHANPDLHCNVEALRLLHNGYHDNLSLRHGPLWHLSSAADNLVTVEAVPPKLPINPTLLLWVLNENAGRYLCNLMPGLVRTQGPQYLTRVMYDGKDGEVVEPTVVDPSFVAGQHYNHIGTTALSATCADVSRALADSQRPSGQAMLRMQWRGGNAVSRDRRYRTFPSSALSVWVKQQGMLR